MFKAGNPVGNFRFDYVGTRYLVCVYINTSWGETYRFQPGNEIIVLGVVLNENSL